MPRWISRTFHQLSGTTVKLIFLVGGFLVLWGMFAPIGTIVWWMNQTAESLGLEEEEKPDVLLQPAVASPASKIDCYIVFLPGVGNFSPDEITEGERRFVDQLAARHPNCVAVRDVFPYSVANQALDQGFSSPLWQAAKDSASLAYVLIQIRNLWRFAISADDRYGPVYNLSIAHTIVDRMNAAHRIARSDRPINLIILGTSGGTQVALGAAPHLNHWINARVTVISLGGTFEGRAGFNDVDHVYHLWGDRDWITQLPRVVFREIIPEQLVQDIRNWSGLTQQLRSLMFNIFGNFLSLFSNSLGVLLNVLIVLVLTIMLLASPTPYRQGFTLLFPASYRPRAEEILQKCDVGLGGWLTGTLANMVIISVLNTIALLILQVPLALANGVLSGVLTFIPNIEPTLSTIPPILLALLDSPGKAIAVLVAYIAIQQLESNVLTPLIMQRQVSLLPAVTLASQLVFASFFGFLGLFLALPL